MYSCIFLCLMTLFLSLDIVHENLKMGSDGESDQASGTSSDEVQSPTGVCLRNRVHRRISMEVRHERTCTHWRNNRKNALTPLSSPALLFTSSSSFLSASWEIWFERGLGGEVHLLMGSQCHDTDSSPAPGGPQQWLAKRCSVIICPVTTVIFYTVCRLSRDGSDSPLFLLKGCI